MAIRYDTVDDGGAFVKVALDEPGDVITFAREACADPKKWDLFEAPMLQRLLVIFQERLSEAQSNRRYDVAAAAEERGRVQGRAEENARQESMADRSILVGAKLKADLRALAKAQKTGLVNLLRRMMKSPRGCWQVHETAKLEKAIRFEILRHETAKRRLRKALRPGL